MSSGENHHRLEFAGVGAAPDAHWLREALLELAGEDWIEFTDPGVGSYRAALLTDGELQACMMVAGRGSLPSRGWLSSLFSAATLGAEDRGAILRGARTDRADPGPTVCACFGVGSNLIRAAARQGCDSVASIGQSLKAGTNCGSCRPEIARLLREVAATEPESVSAAS